MQPYGSMYLNKTITAGMGGRTFAIPAASQTFNPSAWMPTMIPLGPFQGTLIMPPEILGPFAPPTLIPGVVPPPPAPMTIAPGMGPAPFQPIAPPCPITCGCGGSTPPTTGGF